MNPKRLNILESLSILGVYLVAALSSIINIGSAGAAVFLLLVIISIFISTRNAFLLLFLTFYVPTGGIALPIGSLVLITLFTLVIHFKTIFGTQRTTGIKNFMAFVIAITVFRVCTVVLVDDYSLYVEFLMLALYTLLQVLIAPALIKKTDISYILNWWVLFGALASILGFTHHLLEGQTYLTDVVLSSNASRDSSFEVEGFVGWMRWIWAGVEPNFHGLLLLLPYSIALSKLMKKGSIINILLWVIITLGIVGTFSRTSFIVSMLTLMLALVITPSVKYKGTIILFVVLLFSITIYTYQDYVERILTIAENIKTQGGSGRFELYEEAINNTASNPVLGIGTGQTRLYSKVKQDTHNTYLQLFAENGIVCFTIAFYLIIYVFKRAIKVKKTNAVFFLGLFAVCINLNTVSMFDLRPLVSFVTLLFIYSSNENISCDLSRIPARDRGVPEPSVSDSEKLGAVRG